MCHPSDVSSVGGFAPPTLVASPLWNGTPAVAGGLPVGEPGAPTTSHHPQKPTSASAPTMSMAEPTFCGSLFEGLAFGSPGCWRVPSGKSLFQSLEDVPGPDPVSSTALPAIMTCLVSRGSTANCVEN